MACFPGVFTSQGCLCEPPVICLLQLQLRISTLAQVPTGWGGFILRVSVLARPTFQCLLACLSDLRALTDLRRVVFHF